jgi:hypothetical protein
MARFLACADPKPRYSMRDLCVSTCSPQCEAQHCLWECTWHDKFLNAGSRCGRSIEGDRRTETAAKRALVGEKAEDKAEALKRRVWGLERWRKAGLGEVEEGGYEERAWDCE